MGRYSRCYQLISRPVDGDVARAPAPHSYSPGIEILTATGAGLPDGQTEHRHSGTRDQQRNIGSTEDSGENDVKTRECSDNARSRLDRDSGFSQIRFHFMSLVRVGRHHRRVTVTDRSPAIAG